MRKTTKNCKICGKEMPKGLNNVCSQKCQKEKDKLKKQKAKEKKAVSFSVLVEVLDKLVSKYIRTKYSENGVCTCISCEKKITIQEAHNCHRINRGVRLYRFDEDNLRPGCSGCNLFNKEFHLRIFTQKQIERLGINKIQEMSIKAREVGKKPSVEWLQEKIEYYKDKIKELEKN